MKELTHKELLEILDYNQETGIFTWKISKRGVSIGSIAGTISNDRVQIQIGRKIYSASRLAYLYMTGTWPENEVDHINLVKNDNRWVNLRKADHCENNQNKRMQINNTSGAKGVCWDKQCGKWKVQVYKNNKCVVQKHFDDFELAELCAEEARELYHNKFVRHA